MTGAVTKADAERDLVEAWQTLGSAVDSFSEMELEQPGVLEGWTVKDLLGHIAFWAQQGADSLQLIAAGKPDQVQLPGSDEAVDERNERERRLRQDRPLADVRREWLESFDGAMQALAALPAEQLQREVKGQTVLKLFAVDTYEHYGEHSGDLAAWRRELETTET